MQRGLVLFLLPRLRRFRSGLADGIPIAATVANSSVDACYRARPFDSDRERVEFLFALYEKLTAPLTAGLKEPKRRRGS